MDIYSKSIAALLVFIFTGCTSIPDKVPELIEVSANAVDNQAAMTMAEWEAAMAAANSANKLLSHIYVYVSSIDKNNLPDEKRKLLEEFEKGYPLVMHQIDKVLEQSEAPQNTLAKFEEITEAIRFANSYVSKAVDENSRIEAVIEVVAELAQKNEEGEK